MPKKKPLDDIPSEPPSASEKRMVKPPSEPGLGANTYSDRQLAKEFSLSIDNKGKLVREKWGNTALVLAMRAQKASQTYGKKDFNALYRLILSAGIATDKAFPQQEKPLGNNLVVNLFSSLGTEALSSILKPVLPKVEPLVIDTEVIDPSEKPLDETT